MSKNYETEDLEMLALDDDYELDNDRPNRKARAAGNAGDRGRRAGRGEESAVRPARKKKSAKGGARGGKRRRKSKDADIHRILIILVLILIVGAIIAGIRLYTWNKGKESDYDPDNITSEFDVESEDYMMPLTPQQAELQADDGVNSILLLGNGYVARGKGDDDGFAARLERMTGGKVYDASINHSYLSTKNEKFDEKYPTDLFSLYWIIQCMVQEEYSPLINHAQTWDGDDSIVDTVDMLGSLDMASIDTMVIAYDFHDYEEGRTLQTVIDDSLPVSCCACLGLSLKALKIKYPHIRVVVASPYFSYVKSEEGDMVSGETQDFGEGPLGDYMIAYKNVAVNNDASFIDHYFGSISVDNYEKYLDDEYKYPNEKGVELLAERTARFVGIAE